MARAIREIADTQAIVLFDGYCNLCSGSVQFIIKRDPRQYFHFASLQSDAASDISNHLGMDLQQHDSIVLIEQSRIYYQSTAALRIARKLKFPWSLFYGFIILPKFLRNPIYAWIARNRYKWFGQKEQCMVPGEGMKERFL